MTDQPDILTDLRRLAEAMRQESLDEIDDRHVAILRLAIAEIKRLQSKLVVSEAFLKTSWREQVSLAKEKAWLQSKVDGYADAFDDQNKEIERLRETEIQHIADLYGAEVQIEELRKRVAELEERAK